MFSKPLSMFPAMHTWRSPDRVTNFSSEEILKGLKASDATIIRYIYFQYFDSIRNYVMTNSGCTEDAEDIFQEALLIIYAKARKDELVMNCSFHTYLFAICRNLWLQRLYKIKAQDRYLEQEESEHESPDSKEDNEIHSELINLVRSKFEQIEARGQKVLNLFIEGVSHRETARIMNYISEDYAKNRKHHFKTKLKNLVESDPVYQQLKIEMQEY